MAMRLHRRSLIAAALAAAGGARANTPAAESDCPLCRSQLQTLPALRSRLPQGWQASIEAEPVLGGELLVVRAGPRQASPLLLLHGMGQNGFTSWLSTMSALVDRYRLLAVDLPGFGWSSTPAAKLSPTALARVLAALLAREGLPRVTVIGHSLGAAVALRLAAEAARRVNSLVLVDAAGILHRTAFTKHIAAVPLSVQGVPEPLKEPVARLRDLGHQLVERVFGLPPDPTEILRRNEWLWPITMRDRSSVNAALALVEEDYSELVHTLAQPVHVIWGEADAIAPLRTGELLARRLPRAELQVIAGAGHEPMAQSPREFLSALEQALERPPRPRPGLPPATAPAPLPDLVARGEVDRRYSGRFREVTIERCSALRLVDLSAERMVVRDSIVQLTGVQLRGDDIALDVSNSELVATACELEAPLALRIDASRLDLAGVHLSSRGFAVQALARSRLVASVCRLRDARYSGWWHDDRQLERELLDPRSPRGAASGSIR